MGVEDPLKDSSTKHSLPLSPAGHFCQLSQGLWGKRVILMSLLPWSRKKGHKKL